MSCHWVFDVFDGAKREGAGHGGLPLLGDRQRRAVVSGPYVRPRGAGARVAARRVPSGSIPVLQAGRRRRAAPAGSGLYKTRSHQFGHGSQTGVFAHICEALAGERAAGPPHPTPYPTPLSPSGAPASPACAAASRRGAGSPGETTAAPTPLPRPLPRRYRHLLGMSPEPRPTRPTGR